MKVKINSDALKTIAFFQDICKCHVIDCLNTEEKIYFVVGKGEYGMVVGKNGERIKTAEKIFKKPIKVFEYSDDKEQFIKNMIPGTIAIDISNEIVTVKIDNNFKAKTIGKKGNNIHNIKKIAKRIHDVDDIKIK